MPYSTFFPRSRLTLPLTVHFVREMANTKVEDKNANVSKSDYVSLQKMKYDFLFSFPWYSHLSALIITPQVFLHFIIISREII